jgi:hypothetical protein
MTTIPVLAEGDELLATWFQSVAYFLNGSAIVAATGNIANSETQVVGLTVPASGFVAGSTYRLTCYGTATNSSGADRALTLRVRVGPTTLTGEIAGSRAPSIKDTAAAEGWKAEFLFTIRTVGASGTCIANGETVSGPTMPLNTNAFVSNETATVAVDSTVSNVLELTAVTAHASATVNVRQATIERVV